MRTAWAQQAALLAGIVYLTAGPSAQALGDVAKRQAERQGGATGKKYTNSDLGPVPEGVPAAPAVGAGPTAAPRTPLTATAPGKEASKASSPAGDAEASAPPKAVDKRDEKYWRQRAATLLTKVADVRARTKLAEQRLKEMDDALANGAGASHAQERLVAQKALEEVRLEGRYMQEEWTRMEKRAQAANVPPAWLQ